jgi:site-specific recombinase XerD
MNALVVIESSVPAVFSEALELAHDFAKAAKSAATQRAYSSDIAIFVDWCRSRGLSALPASAEVVGAFLAAQAALGKRPSTLGRRLAAVRYFHRAANEASPTAEESVKAVLAGIRRTVGAAPTRKKAATSDIVIAMAAESQSLRGLRNRALLLLGFAGAFRRSELVALNVENLEETQEGLLITIRRGKTDQEGLGRKVAIPRGEIACPVQAVKAWRDAASIAEGALFRRVWNKRAQWVSTQRLTARIVADIVKAGAARLALDPATFGAHSLRSGLVTTAVKRGVNLLKICDQTGHKSLEMLRVYCRDAELFNGNAAAGLL